MSKFNTPFVPPRPISAEEFNWNGTGATMSFIEKFSELAPSLLVMNNLFLMNENGQFEQYELFVGRTHGANMASGRVFITDRDGYLRQLQLEKTDDGGFEISASRPVKNVEPKAPSFWTRVGALFGHKASKAKVQAYNDAKKFNAAFNALTTKEEFTQFNINLNPPDAEYQEETLEPDAPKVEEEDTLKEVELRNPMTKDDFYIQLCHDRNFSQQEFQDVLDKPNVTAQEIKEAHIKLLKSDIARRMLVIRSNDELNMAHAQHTYLILTEDMSPSKYFSDAVERYASAKQTGNEREIAGAWGSLFNATNTEQVENLIERRRPSSAYYKYDEFYASVTEQMNSRKVKHLANEHMRNRQNDLSKQAEKAKELEEFGNELKEAATFTAKDVQAVVMEEDTNCVYYLEALANMMIGQVAKMMLADKKLNLEKAKPIYEALTESIYGYVENTYKQEGYNIMNTLEDEGKEAAVKQSDELVKIVSQTGLREVFAKLNAAEHDTKTFQALDNKLQQPSAENAPNSMVK